MTGQEDDSCEWSGDGECDEPGFGTGACTQGTDRTDCGDVTALRFRNDSCATAFDGVCDEPQGTGLCAARTDRSDCAGRARPLTINDHFFGRDDRVLVDTAAFPWRVIGTISLDVGGTCTASLVARDVLVTAAHCISEDGRINAAGEFVTGAALPGGPRRARIIDFHMDPDWDEQAFSDGDTRDGTDWALLRLDRPLGDELGHLGVYAPGRPGWGELRAAQVRQAGYSWDTGENLSGNLDCRVREIFPDNTLAHDCDTTRGDSGSPFIVDTPDGPAVIATDSNFRSNPDGPFIYIAARADRWIEALPAFAAGQLGAGGVRPAGPGKPGPLTPVKEG
jgi:protease YdgD